MDRSSIVLSMLVVAVTILQGHAMCPNDPTGNTDICDEDNETKVAGCGADLMFDLCVSADICGSTGSCGSVKHTYAKFSPAFVSRCSSSDICADDIETSYDKKVALDLCPSSSTTNKPGATKNTTAKPKPLVTVISTAVELADPTTFNKADYEAAMKKNIVLPEGSTVEVVVKGFSVAVSYELPSNITKGQATTAIALANNVTESKVEVTITSTRRLAASRRLAALVEAVIKLETAAKAKSVQSSSASVPSLKIAFIKAGLEVTPVVKVAPKVAVQVETKVVSSTGTAVQPPDAAGLSKIGTAVGGTVKVVANPTTTTTTTITTKTATTVAEEISAVSSAQSVVVDGLRLVFILGFCSHAMLV